MQRLTAGALVDPELDGGHNAERKHVVATECSSGLANFANSSEQLHRIGGLLLELIERALSR
jgi:hypothetical protein